MVECGLGGTICRTAKFRTPTTIILFKLVTKPNMVEFVFMDSTKLAEMTPAQVARGQMVRIMVKCDNIEHTFSESSWKQHAWTTSSTLSPSTRKSDCSFVPSLFYRSF